MYHLYKGNTTGNLLLWKEFGKGCITCEMVLTNNRNNDMSNFFGRTCKKKSLVDGGYTLISSHINKERLIEQACLEAL